MILTKFSFKQKSKSSDWQIDNLNLGKINLLVGKNATGKSRVLDEITLLSDYLKDFNLFSNDIEEDVKWELEFIDEKSNIIKYKFSAKSNSDSLGMLEENLKVNDLVIVDRRNNKAKIYSQKSGKYQNINPPDTSLIISVRRDKIEFPIFEKILA